MAEFTLNDVHTIEADEDASALDMACALQRAINGGLWSLQGSYGRLMMHAIKTGQCLLGNKGCRDAYGSYIPGRDEVQAGTKGSFDYVVDRMGVDWANKMQEI